MNNKKLFTLLLISSLLILSGCEIERVKEPIPSQNTGSTSSSSNEATAPLFDIEEKQEKTSNIQSMATPTAYAIMKTNKGDMKFELYGNETPELTKNFIELSKAGKYEGVPFHRVIKGFMAQSGDFENKNGTGGYSYQGPGTTLDDEYNEDLTHVYGALASAKTSAPKSIGSQFYIVNNPGGAHELDGRYSVYGLLIEGSETLDTISNIETGGPFGSTPTENIEILSVEIELI